MTTYQHAAYIRECLESVIAQTFPGTLEVLVGDDVSVDGTREVVEEIARGDSRVRAFLHSSNLGPSANLHFLVARARGDFIAHLDGDDFWLPGKLAAQLRVLAGDAGVAAVYCNAQVVDDTGRRLGDFNRRVPARLGINALLRKGNFLNHSSLLYRATSRDVVLGMEGAFIDYRLHFRLLRYGALAYVDEDLVGHRWRTGGSMIRTMPNAVCEGHLDAFREAVGGGANPADLRAAIGRFWGKVLVHALIAGRWAGVGTWARRLTSDPLLKYSRFQLLAASLLALPRAIASWHRRRQGAETVFFP